MAPPPLADLTARAQTLTSAGDLAGARRVLANALDPADTDPRRANADLALAAALHARILIALGDAQNARLWAGFAHAAEERLHGPHDERTVAAAATHAAVLQRAGHHGKAAQVYKRLVRALSAIDGPDAPRVLAAEADLATTEHAAGDCATARTRLGDAWRRHQRLFGDAAPAGIKMLARLGAMERECGRDAESRDHLAQAQELCARYLPFDHPLVRQVAALAVAPASGRHVCGRVEQSGGPNDPPTLRTTPFPRRPTVPDPAEGAAQPDPFGPPPDNRTTDPNGTVYQQPLYLADVHQE
ncbi:MAG: fibronectin type III domain-containing protein, partial [Actinoplanes sp.]